MNYICGLCNIFFALELLDNREFNVMNYKKEEFMYCCGVAMTDVGTVKKVNQDSITLQIAETKMGRACFAMVCDGLGGLDLGEVASGNAILAFSNWFKTEFPKRIDTWTEEKIQKSWSDVMRYVNNKLLTYGKNNHYMLGTTITVMLLWKSRYYIMHVGDSRVYEITNRCIQLTNDQTFIAREIARGRLTREQAVTDARRNVLLQCVGMTEKIVPEFYVGNVKTQATYLLCTDGFRHAVTEEEINHYCQWKAIIESGAMNRNMRYLIELNKRRGERDNISAILIRTDKC